uniref:Peptidase S1 domain-containing protein n=1 Tax=Parascaris univalens TaxID=6257 RepID=A0A915AXU4_PARUN
MTIYASESAEKEVGFVRRLSNEEVLAMLAKRIKTKRTIISRSPLETNLIEMSLLEFRSFAEKENWRKLDEFDETTLNTAMNRQQLSFILFWTNVNSISQHAFWLWSKASEILKPRYADISFGALACHKRPQLCDANQLSKTDDFHTVFAYRNGKRYTSLKDMKDINYYVQWVTMLMSGTAIELKTENDLKEARKGKIASFDELRPAITIGIFDSTSTKHFKMFMEICEIFIGRYHFVYFIKKGSTDRIFTVRPYEKKKRVDFDESFDAESLAQFVTQSSFPSIVDITRGFTSDILLRQPRPVVVLLHSSANEISSFVDFCSTKSRHICTHIIRDRCDILDDMLNQISLDKSDSPKIIVFVKDKIYVSEYEKYKNAKELKEAIEAVIRTDPIKIIAENDVHPLRYLQLAHVNEVFGAQQITLLPDPQIVDTYFHHDIEDMDDIGDSYGGCPVMSRLHRMKDHIKDEL